MVVANDINKKYFYNLSTVYKHCKNNNLNYQCVARSIRYRILKHKENNHSLNYIIDEVINLYMSRKKRKTVRTIILNINSKINISKVCRELQINRSSIYKVMKYGYDSRQAIIITFFLHDINKKEISISEKMVKKINYELQTRCYTKELKYLFCYSYLGYDTLHDIYNELEKNFIRIVKRKKLNYFQHTNTDFIEDIENEFYVFLYNLLSEAKIISNINYQLKWSTLKYSYNFIYEFFRKEKLNQNVYHLEYQFNDNYSLIDTIGTYDKYLV